jgi:hypothetical protein
MWHMTLDRFLCGLYLGTHLPALTGEPFLFHGKVDTLFADDDTIEVSFLLEIDSVT